jgi:hypothetical protein
MPAGDRFQSSRDDCTHSFERDAAIEKSKRDSTGHMQPLRFPRRRFFNLPLVKNGAIGPRLQRATIFSASSGNGRCNAFASSHGARIQTSRSPSVVRKTGIALGWIGSTIANSATS